MRSAEDSLTVLRALFPLSVGAGLPIKVGIRADIMCEQSVLSEEEVAAALDLHVNSIPYLVACLRSGAQRVATSGEPVGDVEPEQRAVAAALVMHSAVDRFAAAQNNTPARARRK